MRSLQLIKFAFTSFLGNKSKTALSGFCIMIGVMAVLAMLTLGDGMYDMVHTGFGDSSNHIIVRKNAMLTTDTRPVIDTRDVSQVESIQGVKAVSPRKELYMAVRYEREESTLPVRGIDPGSETQFQSMLIDGEIPEYSDRGWALIGKNMATQLFKNDIQSGSVIKVRAGKDSKEYTLRVLGIIDENTTPVIEDKALANYIVYVDNDDLASIAGRKNYDCLVVSCEPSANLTVISGEIDETLKQAHKSSSFQTMRMSDLLNAMDIVLKAIKYFLGAIAGISLIVGGIGISNVMILTVKERTMEIGLMKAVGATMNSIRLIFLIEASILGLISSLAGVLLCLLLVEGIAYISKMIPALSNVSLAISLNNALAVTLFGVCVTILASIYPAMRASRLDPVEALRGE